MSERYYTCLLPISLVVFLIGFDTANQSLSALTNVPMAITALHALCMGLSMGVWSLMAERRRLKDMEPSVWRKWTRWIPVLFFFTAYQMMNHLVSYNCSLSERIIFLNLCPLVSLLMETLVMPADCRPRVSHSAKLALALMAVGAVLFTMHKDDFTMRGFLTASSFVLVIVPYRVYQRWAITSPCRDFPVGILAAFDGLALFTPSSIVAVSRNDNLKTLLLEFFGTFSVFLIFFMTVVSFVGVHLLGLLVMRIGPATSYLVYTNLANFALVVCSWMIFQENIAQSVVMVIGLLLSLLSGVWYAIEVQKEPQMSGSVEEPKDVSRKVNNAGSSAADLLSQAQGS